MAKAMKNILIRLTSLTAIFMFSLTMLVPASTSAAVPANCGKGFLGFPHWYEYLEVDGTTCEITGPKADGSNRLDVSKTATRVILAIIDILLRVGGLVAFAFVVFAGFQFVLSSGDTNKEVAARNTVINAAVGMMITIFAVVIVTFVGRALSK